MEDETKDSGKNLESKHSLNLMGEVCPMNFVKIKFKLEQMAKGEILEAKIDKISCGDVIKSLKTDNYNIAYVTAEIDGYKIGIRR